MWYITKLDSLDSTSTWLQVFHLAGDYGNIGCKVRTVRLQPETPFLPVDACKRKRTARQVKHHRFVWQLYGTRREVVHLHGARTLERTGKGKLQTSLEC